MTKFFHLAETREQALNDCRELFPRFTGAGLMGAAPDGTNDDRHARTGGRARRRDHRHAGRRHRGHHRGQEESGGFGGFLGAMYGIVKRDAMLQSYELFARYVAPHFQGNFEMMKANREWVLATGGGPGGPGPARGPGTGIGYARHTRGTRTG